MALEDTAQRLINAKGRPVTLRRPSLTPADPAAPWDNAGSFSDSTVTIVFTKGSSPQLGTTNAQLESFVVLIAGLDVPELTTADRIIDGTEEYRVTAAERVQPGATLYIWKATIAK